MAQEYSNVNRGSIWKNDKKETEKHPDFTGTLNVNGVEFWVSGWKRKPEQSENAPALSFSIKAKEDTKPKAVPLSKTNHHEIRDAMNSNDFDDFENDIPF